MRHSSSHTNAIKKPKKFSLKDWKEIFGRVRKQINHDHLLVVSGGIAFFFFLAIFPALIATVSIYGLVVSPAEVQQQMSQITAQLPEKVHIMISDILKNIADKSGSTLSWSVFLGVLISLYSAKKGITALFEGINIAYNEMNERPFLKKNGLELLFTFGAIITGILALIVVAVWPAIVEKLGLPAVLQAVISWGRWILLALIIVFSLGLIYKVAPDRRNPEFKWASPGSVVATLLWIGISLLFSWYVDNFGSYDKTYGSFATVIILMLWFLLTSFIILLGAEINSEMEHQTSKDSTIGQDKPMGQRGAYYADRVAGGEKDD